jgi:DNA (cytosine-5)-methyltransferase 1
MRILDLYCGAGGAGRGYHQAGFEVVGADLNPQPDYPFAFIRTDALALDMRFLRSFDAIHASPTCQKHTAMKTMHNAKVHVDLIPPTRAMLLASGLPYVMENVVGARLINPVRLCGTMFGLGADGAELQRHRDFEANFPISQPQCLHSGGDVLGLYGGHVRNRRRREGSSDRGVADFTNAQGFEAMGVEVGSMTLGALCQAIPPAYTKFIGDQLAAFIASGVAVAA